MAKISVVYLVVGTDPNDGAWAFTNPDNPYIKGGTLMATDAPGQNTVEERIKLIQGIAEAIKRKIGRDYRIQKFIPAED